MNPVSSVCCSLLNLAFHIQVLNLTSVEYREKNAFSELKCMGRFSIRKKYGSITSVGIFLFSFFVTIKVFLSYLTADYIHAVIKLIYIEISNCLQPIPACLPSGKNLIIKVF